MKIHTLLLFFLLSPILHASDWEVLETKATKTEVLSSAIKSGESCILVEVTIKNISTKPIRVMRSPYLDKKDYAKPNTFLWPEGKTANQAISSAVLSHYYKYNSRCCDPHNYFDVKPNETAKLFMYDSDANIGKRLLLTVNLKDVVGSFTIPQIK